MILLRNCRNGPHQVFSGKIGQAVEARMRTRAMQRSKCTIVLKVFATRTAWDFHNVIPTDHRSFLNCNVLLGMSIKDIVKMCMHNNNYFYGSPPWDEGSVGLVIQGSAVGSLAPATWKSCWSGWKFMDSHKIHKVLVQMAKRLDWMLGHNECCSAPSPRSYPACNLCERNTFVKHKHWCWWDDNACVGEKKA